MNRDTCGTCFAPSDLCQCPVLAALTEAHKELDAAKKILALMGNPFGEPQGPVEKGFRLAGWRRCAEEQEEYELIGRIFGTYGGRWVFIPDNKHMAWPEGTAVYVRRRQA